jgi:SAM-dependent methyltransferase
MSFPTSYTDRFKTQHRRYANAMATAPTVRAAEFRELFREYTPPTGSFILDIPAVDSYLARHLPLDVELRPVDFLPSSLESLLVPEPGTAPMRLPICDACVCIGALHHLAADDVLLQEFYQALNPGGLVYLADPQVGSSTAEFLDAGNIPWVYNVGRRTKGLPLGF